MKSMLYVLDSLRADDLSCYGYERETSPNIDELAEDSVVFQNAIAQSAWTRASAASILSSLYPSVYGVNGMDDYFSYSDLTLPGAVVKEGFETIGMSAMGNV